MAPLTASRDSTPTPVHRPDDGSPDGAAESALKERAPAPRWTTSRSVYQILTGAGPLSPDDVARLGAAVATELARLHRQGEVHGDIRVETIIVCPDGRVWLVDPLTAGRIAPVSAPVGRRPPEVVHGGAHTPATDVYQLGLVLLAALGRLDRHPRHDHRRGDLRAPLIPPGLRPAWSQVLMGMVADAPSVRLSAADVAARLGALASPEPGERGGADTDLIDLTTGAEDEPVGGMPAATTAPLGDTSVALPSGAIDGLLRGRLAGPALFGAPTARQLGVIVLAAVSVLFALLLTFGTAEPSTEAGSGAAAVAEAGDSADTGVGP